MKIKIPRLFMILPPIILIKCFFSDINLKKGLEIEKKVQKRSEVKGNKI